MKIAFHTNEVNLRGTTISTYNYAKYNQEILGNESIIVSYDPDYNKASGTDKLALEYLGNMCPLYLYKDFSEVEKMLDDNKVDFFYAQRAGYVNDGIHGWNIVSPGRKTGVHCIFQHYQPHGDVYAYISEWLGKKYNSPHVSYIIDLPEIEDDLRQELNIPKDAIVFGRHGGLDTFNLEYARQAVIEIAMKRKDIYFLFLYTPKFADDSIENIIHIPKTYDLNQKVKFINTCDAMLHARTQGESFGAAIAEFSVKDRPILTNAGGRDSAHYGMLGQNGIVYHNKQELIQIINDFKPYRTGEPNYYKQLTPENMMKQFKEVFLS